MNYSNIMIFIGAIFLVVAVAMTLSDSVDAQRPDPQPRPPHPPGPGPTPHLQNNSAYSHNVGGISGTGNETKINTIKKTQEWDLKGKLNNGTEATGTLTIVYKDPRPNETFPCYFAVTLSNGTILHYTFYINIEWFHNSDIIERICTGQDMFKATKITLVMLSSEEHNHDLIWKVDNILREEKK